MDSPSKKQIEEARQWLEEYNQKNEETCSICLEETSDEHWECEFNRAEEYRKIETACGHAFHFKCLMQWVKTKRGYYCGKFNCPSCKEESFTNKDIRKAIQQEITAPDEPESENDNEDLVLVQIGGFNFTHDSRGITTDTLTDRITLYKESINLVKTLIRNDTDLNTYLVYYDCEANDDMIRVSSIFNRTFYATINFALATIDVWNLESLTPYKKKFNRYFYDKKLYGMELYYRIREIIRECEQEWKSNDLWREKSYLANFHLVRAPINEAFLGCDMLTKYYIDKNHWGITGKELKEPLLYPFIYIDHERNNCENCILIKSMEYLNNEINKLCLEYDNDLFRAIYCFGHLIVYNFKIDLIYDFDIVRGGINIYNFARTIECFKHFPKSQTLLLNIHEGENCDTSKFNYNKIFQFINAYTDHDKHILTLINDHLKKIFNLEFNLILFPVSNSKHIKIYNEKIYLLKYLKTDINYNNYKSVNMDYFFYNYYKGLYPFRYSFLWNRGSWIKNITF